MVVFDTSFLSLAFDTHASPPLDPNTGAPMTDSKERVDYLIKNLSAAKARILIPTPVVAEFMVRGGADKERRLEVITTSRVFVVASFDLRAAIECSMIEDSDIATGKPLDELKGKQKVKFDRQIIAIALAQRAQIIYTGDRDLSQRAKKCGLQSILSWELDPLPKPPVSPQQSLDLPRPENWGTF